MQVIMEVTEHQIVPGETNRFPFIVPMGNERPPILEFHVISDNPNFDPRWANVVRSADGTRARTIPWRSAQRASGAPTMAPIRSACTGDRLAHTDTAKAGAR
jgi:hypothetical protein